jgi:tRNA-splicing ligase RtcB
MAASAIDVKVFGPEDARSRQQLQTCIDATQEPEVGAVLCADHHPGYSMPIGGVLALRSHVIPAGVGYDIACGNCAVRTELLARDVDVPGMMDEIWRTISFGMGRQNRERADAQVLDEIAHSPVVAQRGLAQLAADQLGTVGGGNHYVDLFEDRGDGALWVGVHFGSRGFGHKTASGFLAVAAGRSFSDHVSEGGMDSVPLLLSLDQPSGQDYLAAMEIAGHYAYAGRDWVVDRVLQLLGTRHTYRVHNHHNYAWTERHHGQQWLVIRKGATPAFPGQDGFVGGTMGDDAVILRGVDSAEAQAAFRSTVHGAGRVMSRTAAAGKTRRTARWKCQNYRACSYAAAKGGYHKDENGPTPKCPECGHKLRLTQMHEQVKAGVVDWPAWQAQLQAQGVELRGGGADEAPQCYKRLEEVLAYHAGTVEVLHRLRPVGVAMASAETYDPYRD